MTDKELNDLIAYRISYFLEEQHKTQQELADFMGVTQGTVSNWCKGTKTPRMSKVDRIAEFFHVNRSDLMDNEKTNEYYLDPEVTELAQELVSRPEMKILFDASRKATKEDIEQVAAILDKLGNK